MTEAGLQKLHKQMPQLTIHWDGGIIEPTEKPATSATEDPTMLPLALDEEFEPIGDREFFTQIQNLDVEFYCYYSPDYVSNPERVKSALTKQDDSTYALKDPGKLGGEPDLVNAQHLYFRIRSGENDGERLEQLAQLLRLRSSDAAPVSLSLNFPGMHPEQLDVLRKIPFFGFSTIKIEYTPETIQQISQLGELSAIAICQAQIDGDELANIWNSPNIRNLRYLVLDKNPINDDHLQVLLKFPQLNRLSLLHTQVTEAGVEKLHEQMPHLKIIWDGGVIEPSNKKPATSAADDPTMLPEMIEPDLPLAYEWPEDQPAPAIVPFSEEEAQQHQQAWADHLESEVEITNSIGMKLRLVPPGELWMKDVETRDQEEWGNRTPDPSLLTEKVVIPRPYWMGMYEVTRGQFRQFVEETGYQPTSETSDGMGWKDGKAIRSRKFTWDANPGFEIEPTDEHPVVNVSPRDAIAFCHWLSDKEGVIYRLPTEAEWEFACGAGSMSAYHFGDEVSELNKYAWYHSQGGVPPILSVKSSRILSGCMMSTGMSGNLG